MNKNILFLSSSYMDIDSDSGLYTELIQQLKKNVNVKVVAPSFENNKKGLYDEGGVDVIRVPFFNFFNKNPLLKGIKQVLMPIMFYIYLTKYMKNWDIDWVIMPTPPITLSPLVYFLKKKFDAKFYLILRDIFPQNAVDMGFIRKPSLLYAIFRRIERFTYGLSDAIGCMSKANVDYLIKKNKFLDPDLIYLLENWGSKLNIIDKNSALVKNIDKKKFKVLFGGNLGIPQNTEFLIDVASKIKSDSRFEFIIIGTGTEKNKIQKKISDNNLKNVKLVNKVSRDKYQLILKEADLGLVLLNKNFTIPNVPSRLIAYWSASLPVLAATDRFTDVNSSFLKPNSTGLWVEMGDIEAFIDCLYFFLENPVQTREMGIRGRDLISKKYTSDVASDKLLHQLGLIDHAL